MATIETAKKKWVLKVKGEKWKRGVTGRGPDYCKGVAEFLGVSTCNPAVQTAYTAGVDAVTASDFDRAVSGKERISHVLTNPLIPSGQKCNRICSSCTAKLSPKDGRINHLFPSLFVNC